MTRNPGRIAALMAMLLELAAAPAVARDWSVGSNLGLSVLNARDAPNVTYLSFPGTVVALQPGLRVGLRGASPHQEAFVDAGLTLATASGFSSTSLGLTGNYQLNLTSGPGTRPFVDGGLGFLYASREIASETASATSATFGLGVGLRHVFPGRQGDLRGELRWDYVTKGEDGDVVLTPAGAGVGIKLGFDLWLGGNGS